MIEEQWLLPTPTPEDPGLYPAVSNFYEEDSKMGQSWALFVYFRPFHKTITDIVKI